jgi:hypothetical protein
MADREAQQKLYAYSEMSNKVQQANAPNVDHEVTAPVKLSLSVAEMPLEKWEIA